MNLRKMAVFRCSLPDDMIVDEREVIQYPGKNIAELMINWLRDAGYKALTPEHQFDHGWDFYVEGPSRAIWIQVSVVDSVYLHSEIAGLFSFLEKKEFHLAVLQTVHEGLTRDPRFEDVRWYHVDEYQRGGPGASQPLI